MDGWWVRKRGLIKSQIAVLADREQLFCSIHLESHFMRFSWVAEQLCANHIPFRRLMTLTLSWTFMNEYLLPHSTWYNSEFAFDIGLNGPLVVVVVVGHGWGFAEEAV